MKLDEALDYQSAQAERAPRRRLSESDLGRPHASNPEEQPRRRASENDLRELLAQYNRAAKKNLADLKQGEHPEASGEPEPAPDYQPQQHSKLEAEQLRDLAQQLDQQGLENMVSGENPALSGLPENILESEPLPDYQPAQGERTLRRLVSESDLGSLLPRNPEQQPRRPSSENDLRELLAQYNRAAKKKGADLKQGKRPEASGEQAEKRPELLSSEQPVQEGLPRIRLSESGQSGPSAPHDRDAQLGQAPPPSYDDLYDAEEELESRLRRSQSGPSNEQRQQPERREETPPPPSPQ